MTKKIDKDGDVISPVTLTFSKKNEDIYYILKKISEDGTKKTDYICTAVRAFYNKKINDSTSTESPLNKNLKTSIENIVVNKINEILKSENLQLITKSDIDISDINAGDLEDD